MISSQFSSLSNLLDQHEFIKDSERECNIKGIDIINIEDYWSILITDSRIIFLKDAVFSDDYTKVPSSFGKVYFIYISSIIIHAIASPGELDPCFPCLYFQIEDNIDLDKIVEVKIFLKDMERVRRLFNIVCELSALSAIES
ncbi:hypothetical protein ACR3K2_33660 [Cryptosporidium serpentis]